MISSSVPTLVPLPFAASGSKHAIPTASQIGITAGAASLTDGFPPLTFTPIASGGVPPDGNDMNGILNLISANTNWANAGGTYPYNSAFSTYIGGYPKGAVLIMAAGTGFWLSTIDNNTTNPESGPSANWIAFGPFQTQSGANNYASDTGLANAYVVTLSPVPVALIPGLMVRFIVGHTNTGASTLNVNGTGALTITIDGTNLPYAGQISAGALVNVVFDGTSWQIINPHTVDATTSIFGRMRFGTNAEQLAGLLGTVGCTPAGLASGFGGSGANRYYKLPGGFILQFGSALGTGNIVDIQSLTINYPISFPNNVFQVVGNTFMQNSWDAFAIWRQEFSSNLSSVIFTVREINNTTTQTGWGVSYIALGN
jgi:hypothetical protein